MQNIVQFLIGCPLINYIFLSISGCRYFSVPGLQLWFFSLSNISNINYQRNLFRPLVVLLSEDCIQSKHTRREEGSWLWWFTLTAPCRGEVQAHRLNPQSAPPWKCVWGQWDVYKKIASGKIGGIMALGRELAINNAEETAVNVPFNSTGLQTAGRLFFLGSGGATSSSALIRFYGSECACFVESLPRPHFRLESH